MYLIYGRYWLLNLVTGKEDEPQAVLIRGTRKVVGPGKLGKRLELDGELYGEDVTKSKRLWVEDKGLVVEKREIRTSGRRKNGGLCGRPVKGK